MKNEKNENNDENSGPLTSLPVNRLNGDRLQRRRSCQCNFCQAQSQSNPISIDWTEIALSLLKTNHHLGSATDPPTQDSKRKRS